MINGINPDSADLIALHRSLAQSALRLADGDERSAFFLLGRAVQLSPRREDIEQALRLQANAIAIQVARRSA